MLYRIPLVTLLSFASPATGRARARADAATAAAPPVSARPGDARPCRDRSIPACRARARPCVPRSPTRSRLRRSRPSPYPTAQPLRQPSVEPRVTRRPPRPAARRSFEEPAKAPEVGSRTAMLVFANLYGLSFNILADPSGDFTFFLGTNLRPRRNRARTFDWNTALGYQLTLSGRLRGHAQPSASPPPELREASFVHRHHFTAMGYGGQSQRLFYSMGGGVSCSPRRR